jgi:hypothetical protein
VLRAPMPKAPVHEDRHALPSKHKVGAAAEPTFGRDVNAIAAAASMQFPPKPQLGRRITRTICLHHGTSRD